MNMQSPFYAQRLYPQSLNMFAACHHLRNNKTSLSSRNVLQGSAIKYLMFLIDRQALLFQSDQWEPDSIKQLSQLLHLLRYNTFHKFHSQAYPAMHRSDKDLYPPCVPETIVHIRQ